MAGCEVKERIMATTYTVEDAVCVGESDLAIKVKAPEFDGAVWVPKSHVDDDSEVYAECHEGKLIVTEWIAKQKGWL